MTTKWNPRPWPGGECCGGQHWDKWGNWDKGCTLGILSFCLSLYAHTHHQKCLLKAGHTCVSVWWKCATTRRSSTDVKDLLFSVELPVMALYSYTPHTHTHPASRSFVLQRVVQPWSKWSQENFQPVLWWLHVSLLDSGTLVQACRLAPVISSLRFLCIQQRWRGQGGPLSRRV